MSLVGQKVSDGCVLNLIEMFLKQGILDGVAAWREGPPTDDVSLMLVHVR